MSELPKTFDPAEIEARWYAHWEEEGLFRPERDDAEPFTIVNPPPNVTGSLHIGHALDNTLQDILIRRERMRGKDALWVVGTDHAGIATQMVVERQLNERQQKRTDFSRAEFVAKVWEWKEESGGTITRQLRRLGCSMDWSNERFTMDEGFTKAVTKVFVDLYNEGLIYRDKRLVNWDPGLKTAISDLEVENVEIAGHFWHFKYPLEDGVTLDSGEDFIEVATTRPETMLADMAVAVHPSDERYASVVGKHVVLPITGRRVPIIADEHADPELGSGAVKITPGHDFNDFEVGKRAGIAPADMLNMLDGEANVCQTADGLVPDEYIGLHRFRRDGVDGARELVVQRIKDAGCLIPHVTKDKDGEETVHDAEPRKIMTPYGDRSNVVIEPWLTDQWYVDAETLAQEPIKAVREGDIEIVPKSWEKTFFNWMENIQPWCVSRQLWWGHRIPAWYGPVRDGEHLSYNVSDRSKNKVFVAKSESEALKQARDYYAEDREIEFTDDPLDGMNSFLQAASEKRLSDKIFLLRDADVLDTWFSSALWPFATLGWPDDAADKALPLDGGGLGGGEPSASAVPGGDVTPPPAPPHQGEGRTVAKPGTALARHYPNDVLISGFDILFFWDARMMMQGMHLMGKVPWKTLYLHGLVRAADGQKMSKSKGNTVDPLGLIDKFGADALRFFMAAMESQGRDIKMDEKRLEGYRNFATKLWNAARFCQSNGIGASETLEPPPCDKPVNRWIVAETIRTVQELDLAFADFRFDGAANTIYHFTWDRYCDWYLELIKPVMSGDERGEIDDETRAVAGWVLDQILVMLHPFMPFVTEELWSKLGDRADYPLITAKWPLADARAMDEEAAKEIDWLIRFVREVRGARSELNVPPGAKLDLYFAEASESARTVLSRDTAALGRLARIGDLHLRPPPDGSLMQVVVDESTYYFPLEGVIDLDAEKARLAKALEAAEKEVASLDKRLSNPQFVEKAKPEAVEKARADHAEKAAEAERLKAALARLG
ncbi:MAG: valine--tRNA ligase [Parasphingopyxis sp.]|uniref:valine--tRNA ligase n=1 Tax=Parasphingopyxis sp. TaxID=1920299 RepID=UPI0032EB38D1